MPSKLFFNLESDKQKKIINAGILEFAKYGYHNSSTNRIVKSSGISKGSLFKYFAGKEDFFFYILDNVTAELAASLEEASVLLPAELFEKIIKYSEAEFMWYTEHPEEYQLIINAFTTKDSEIYQKIQSRYSLPEQDIYYKLMENINMSQLQGDKQKIIDILKWFLNGFNEDFISRLQEGHFVHIDSIRNEYIESLTQHMELLKTGLMKPNGR